jgi:hypothetical protein
MKFSLFALLIPGLAMAAILPDTIGPAHRTTVSAPNLQDKQLWDEYGLKESEAADYENGDQHFTVTAWRLQDPTGAVAAFDWQRPAAAKPSALGSDSAATEKDLTGRYGNYVLQFSGYKPTNDEWKALTAALPHLDLSATPALPGFLPAAGLVPNSERYVTGPTSLQRFAPSISPSVAGFHFGTEATLGVFRGAKGDMTLAVFNYPTHQIAMQKISDFEKVPGVLAKRSGPLVAVVLNPQDADGAEGLLAQVRYEAQIIRDEYVPTRRDNIGYMLLTICVLTGILAAFALVSGLAYGGLKVLLGRGRKGDEAEVMISLHLERR